MPRSISRRFDTLLEAYDRAPAALRPEIRFRLATFVGEVAGEATSGPHGARPRPAYSDIMTPVGVDEPVSASGD